MRVLHLISSVYFFGAERVIAELSASLPRMDVTVHVGILTVDDELSNIFRQVIANPNVSVVRFEGQGMLNFKSIKKISRYVRENEIEIIHSHGYKSNIYAFLAKYFTNCTACIFSTNHNWIGTTTREKVYQKLDALTLRFFNRVVAVSPGVRNQMTKTGIKANKISIINNGINTEDPAFHTPRQNARMSLGISDEDFVIGNIARLTPEKAHGDLLNVLSKLTIPKLKLVLVGDGSESRPLKSQIAKLGLQNKVILTGNRNDARCLYSAFDIFAIVSTNEGLPMVLLEAMAAGVPVIATRVGAIPKFFRDGENALLINPSKPQELLTAILTLTRSSNLRQKLAAAGQQKVAQSFSSRFMAEEYHEQYASILRKQQK